MINLDALADDYSPEELELIEARWWRDEKEDRRRRAADYDRQRQQDFHVHLDRWPVRGSKPRSMPYVRSTFQR